MNKFKLIQGDITKLDVDAIVNAANTSLLGGGGVDGAIHRAGGPAILEACKKIRAVQGTCPTGEAVITTAGNMPARFVIHTVGPIWNPSEPERMDALLANCYANSLELAVKNNIQQIAFPNISTGVYRFPKERAARIAIQTCQKVYIKNISIKNVVFVCFDEENYHLYRQLLDEKRSISDDG